MIIQHYIELMRYHRKQLITLVLATAVAFAVINTAILLTSPTYTAAAAVTMVPTEAEMAFSQGGTNRKEAGRALTETYIEYVKSRPVIVSAIEKIAGDKQEPADQIVKESGLREFFTKVKELKSKIRRWTYILGYGTYVPIPEEDKQIESLRKAINVKNVTNTHILRIEVSLPDPETAAQFANTLAEAYVERMDVELNSDASELEKYLNEEIKKREKDVASLRAKQKAYKKRYGLLPENNSEQRQIDILEKQLDVLQSRLLSTKLARTSATQVHVIEPAVAPVYPSSPNVLKNTLLGLLAGIILSLIIIVAKDSVTDKIVTSVDLQRIAGPRGIGIMKRAWITRRKWRVLRKLGAELERRLAILGDFEASLNPVPVTIPNTTELIQRQEYQLPVRTEKLLPIKQLEHTGEESDPDSRPILQVTGMTDTVSICWAAVGLAAALAVQGRNVICKLPEGTIKNQAALEKWNQGRIHFTDASQEGLSRDTLTVHCLGPLSADLSLTKALSRSRVVVCILPVNQVQEEMVEALQQRISAGNRANISFMLMA